MVELRQYTLFGGCRDELIELFERAFIEPQNVLGARILGTFRDLDDPDRFVWIRGFGSMPARKEALTRFYTGPIWKQHRAAANATMVDSGNVLLLRPVGTSRLDSLAGPHGSRGVWTARITYMHGTDPESFAAFFDTVIEPALASIGIRSVAKLVTEPAFNDFPALPVRTGEPVFVWFTRFPDERSERAAARAIAGLSGWRDRAPEALLPALARKPELLRLRATDLSPLR